MRAGVELAQGAVADRAGMGAGETWQQRPTAIFDVRCARRREAWQVWVRVGQGDRHCRVCCDKIRRDARQPPPLSCAAGRIQVRSRVRPSWSSWSWRTCAPGRPRATARDPTRTRIIGRC